MCRLSGLITLCMYESVCLGCCLHRRGTLVGCILHKPISEPLYSSCHLEKTLKVLRPYLTSPIFNTAPRSQKHKYSQIRWKTLESPLPLPQFSPRSPTTTLLWFQPTLVLGSTPRFLTSEMSGQFFFFLPVHFYLLEKEVQNNYGIKQKARGDEEEEGK